MRTVYYTKIERIIMVTGLLFMYEENFCIRRIKELMEKNHFNAYRLASKAGISLSTLTSMFEKNTDPRVQTLEKICSACGISISQFFERSSKDLTTEQEYLLEAYDSLSPSAKQHLISYLNYLAQNNPDSKKDA